MRQAHQFHDRRKPDFSNLLAVLARKVPARPTLFEFFFNDRLNQTLPGRRPAAARGGYALGTGNSIPMYVPDENYLAIISAIRH